MRPRFVSIAALGAALVSSAARADEALPSPLTSARAAAYARAHRLEIDAARLRARAARERPAMAAALEDPVVSPSIDHLPFELHGADLSLVIEQQVPLSGLLGHRGRSAEAAAVRADAEAQVAALDVELDAKLAFLMLRERREMAAVIAEQRALAAQVESAVMARYATGAGAQAEAVRAELERARVDGEERSNAAELRAAELMFNASLGRPADAPVPVLASDTTTVAPPSAAAIHDAALARRPELRAGAADVGRAEAEIEVMEAMAWPMAMVRTGPAYTMSDGAGWMLMVGVSLPIWRSRLDAGVREAEAMASMARADVSAMRRMIAGEAQVRREQVRAARERYLTLRDHIVPLARRAIEPSLAAYAAGQLPLAAVIEAAQGQRSAETELIMARRELGAAWARLERALGEQEMAR